MLMPIGGFPIREYDVTLLVTPTSKFGHSSDTVFATVEMQVVNNEPNEIEFPFVALSTDSGEKAENDASVAPKITNGSRDVDITGDELDQGQRQQLIDGMVQRAQAAGAADLDAIRAWAEAVLDRAQRTKVGRTKIKAGESRRIVLQQRLRVLPKEGVCVLDTIAPTPAAALQTGGRVSVVALLPWEDEDVKPEIVEGEGGTTPQFEYEKGPIKKRQWVAWHWPNDPVFRLAWRYGG
jgi:hypothetical protein